MTTSGWCGRLRLTDDLEDLLPGRGDGVPGSASTGGRNACYNTHDTVKGLVFFEVPKAFSTTFLFLKILWNFLFVPDVTALD